jgi:hypothetical protein
MTESNAHLLKVKLVEAVKLCLSHGVDRKQASIKFFHQGLYVASILVQIPNVATDRVVHINISLFNGTGEDIYLRSIEGHIAAGRKDMNENTAALGKLGQPRFFEMRRTHILAFQEFSFILAQDVPQKFAEALANWNEEVRYELDFERLDIVVQSAKDATKVARPHYGIGRSWFDKEVAYLQIG